jgi:hypothetical protein
LDLASTGTTATTLVGQSDVPLPLIAQSSFDNPPRTIASRNADSETSSAPPAVIGNLSNMASGIEAISSDQASVRNSGLEHFARLNGFGETSDHGSRSAGASPLGLSVIGQETHFAPVSSLSPVQQISNALATLTPPLTPAYPAGSGGTNAPGLSPLASAIVEQPSAPAIKTLDIALEPDSLGSVTVKLRLSGERLELKIEASRSETMRLIDRDKDALSTALQSSGYSVDGLEIKVGGSQPTRLHGLDARPDQQFATQSDSQAAATGVSQDRDRSAPDSNAQNRNGQDRNAQDHPAMQRDHRDSQPATRDGFADATSVRNVGGDLYV